MNALARISDGLVRFVDRYLPEPFAFAIGMTVVAFALALLATPKTPAEVVAAWGGGLTALLPFITQIALMVLFAYALAHLGPVPRWIDRLARLPNSPPSAYAWATLFAGLMSLINWPLGLILGGVMARSIARSARARGLRLHYPLLGGAAFGGFVVWHMGYSGSAPLFVATAGNAMESQLGGVIPVSETIFAPWNLALAVVTLASVAGTAALLHPRREEDVVEIAASEVAPAPLSEALPRPRTPRERLEHSRWPTLALGVLLCWFAVHWFRTRGLELDLNIVNWTFLAAGLLLARSSYEYIRALYTGGRAIVPILLQYPLYGGIMGLMLGTGLVSVMAPWFTNIANAKTLPLVAFLFAGLVNVFIPSGGAQWIVQGPAFVAAAQELGTEFPLIVMAVAYGDQWTNLIHPFTVLILLAMTGLEARQVLAYSAVLFMVAGLVLGVGLLCVAMGVAWF